MDERKKERPTDRMDKRKTDRQTVRTDERKTDLHKDPGVNCVLTSFDWRLF
jgi:hypothetical protein